MRTLFVSFLIFSSCALYGQQKKLVDIIQNQVRDLNGEARMNTGAFISRAAISIDFNMMPDNAVALIYTVQAYKKGEKIEKIPSLAAELTKLMNANVPLPKALAQLKLPKGTMAADVYLLAATIETQQFLNKNDGHWQHYKEYDKVKSKNTRVYAKWPLEGVMHAYIAVKNSSAMDTVKVVVNAVSVLSE